MNIPATPGKFSKANITKCGTSYNRMAVSSSARDQRRSRFDLIDVIDGSVSKRAAPFASIVRIDGKTAENRKTNHEQVSESYDVEGPANHTYSTRTGTCIAHRST